MIFDDETIRRRFTQAFPCFFINHNLEAIVHPKRNTYFLLSDVQTETDLKAKILEWLSREAAKSVSKQSMKYHLDGINFFLGTDFTQADMMEIYTYLGNRCNHAKTLRFIESGYDLAVLKNEGAGTPET
jgi:hypothetical protein